MIYEKAYNNASCNEQARFSPKFRMASGESGNEKPTTQEKESSKSKTVHETETKCDPKETGNRLTQNRFRRVFRNSLFRFRRSSKNVTVKIKSTADGAIFYPMERGGQLYIIRMYLLLVY